MTVDSSLQAQGGSSPVQGAYVQPGPGIAMPGVVLFDKDGVAVTSIAGGGVDQGSTTSGQTGALVQGAVTTGVPTYVTGKTDPLSLDTSGRMRGMNWLYRDSIVTVQASGTATAPSAADVIATITPGTAGIWEITVTISISGTSVVATESNNMSLYQTAAAVIDPLIFAATTAGTPQPITFKGILLNLSAVDTVNVKAKANATAVTPIYAALIVARRVG